MTCSTGSIQNVAIIFDAWALDSAAAGLVNAAGSPRRKVMLSVPPPNNGAAGLVEMEIVEVKMMFCDACGCGRACWGQSTWPALWFLGFSAEGAISK